MIKKIDYKKYEKHLPPMGCEKCGECCGIVPCTDIEYAAVVDYAYQNGIKPHRYEDAHCPWFDLEKGCLVYPVRPFACRLFGHVKELKCARGHDKKVVGCKGKTLTAKYMREIGKPSRLLSEITEKP